MQAVALWPPSELTIRGPDAQIALLRQWLEQAQALEDGWKRDLEIESRLNEGRSRRRDVFCFACLATGRRPAATLLLEPRGPGNLYVSLVTPKDKRRFSDEEYNLILAEFASEVLRPARGSIPRSNWLPGG